MLPNKRVLSLDPAGLLWGSERALLDFIGEVPGYEMACCCPPDTPLVDKLKAADVRCFPYFETNLHLRGYLARTRALFGLIRAMYEFRPHVVHVNQAGATRIALFACRLFGVPCVSHVRLLEDVDYLAALNPNSKSLPTVIAVSGPIHELIKGTPRLASISSCVLLDAYRPKGSFDVTPATSEKRWDFVCVGRFCRTKGQELLIKSLAAIRENGDCPTLAFIGEVNSYGEELQTLVDDLGLAKQVAFLGHSDEVGGYITQASWLICPSEYEPLGRVIFEAWDWGIPVIAGAFSGGAAASIGSSGGGLLFDKWEVRSLAATLRAAVNIDDATRNRMAGGGRRWLYEATDPERYACSIAKIFDQALKGVS